MIQIPLSMWVWCFSFDFLSTVQLNQALPRAFLFQRHFSLSLVHALCQMLYSSLAHLTLTTICEMGIINLCEETGLEGKKLVQDPPAHER